MQFLDFRKASYVLLTVSIVFVAMYFNPYRFVEFVPVCTDGTGDFNVVERSDIYAEPGFVDSLARVLDRYNESYKRLDGKIHIQRKLATDTDLMLNYTEKARSPDALMRELEMLIRDGKITGPK